MPQRSMCQRLGPELGASGSGRAFKRSGEKSSGHWWYSVPLSGTAGPQPLFSCVLLLPRQEVNSFALSHTPAMMCCLGPGPKSTGTLDHVLKPPNGEPK